MARNIIKRNANTVREFFRVAQWTWKMLLKFLPPSLEVFLHRQFGERYFLRIGGSFLLFILYAQLMLCSPEIASRGSEVFFLGLYSLCFFGLALFHVVDLFIRRYRLGGGVFSYSAGIPFLSWQRLRLSPAVTQRYVEPALCICVALALQRFARVLSLWLVLSTITAFVKYHIEWWTNLNRALDAMDGRIEAQQVNASVQRRISPRQPAPGRFYEVAPGRRPGDRPGHR